MMRDEIIKAVHYQDDFKIILKSGQVIKCNLWFEHPAYVKSNRKENMIIINRKPDDCCVNWERLVLRLDDISGVLIQGEEVKPHDQTIQVVNSYGNEC